MQSNEKIKIVLRGIFSFILIIVIVYFIGIEAIKEAITKVRIESLILVLAFFVVSMFITTLAVHPFLKKLPIHKILKFKAISWSTGMFLPSKIGEASFVLSLRKIGMNTRKAAAIFILDRFISFSIIIVISFFGLLKFFTIQPDLRLVTIFLVICGITIVLKNRIKKIKQIQKSLNILKETKNYLKKEKKAVITNYFFSFINFLIVFWLTQQIFLSIGINIGFIDVMLISSISMLVSTIPISLSGVGIREMISVYLYSTIGINPEYSLSVLLIFLVLSYFMATVFLILFYDDLIILVNRKQGI